MNLEQMDLTNLQTLQRGLVAAEKAGKIMIEAGFEPTFAISDRAPLMTVPPIGAAHAAPQITAQITHDKPRDPPRICKDGPRLDQGRIAALERLAKELHGDPAPAIETTAEGHSSPLDPVALTDASPPASGQEEPAPKQTADAPKLAAGDDPAASPAQRALAPVYTEEDTAIAIAMHLDLQEQGEKLATIFEMIGKRLGRNASAIKTQFYGAWADALSDERVRRAAARKAGATPAPEPKAPAKSIHEDPLVQRITTLRMPSQWDFAADLRMLTMKVQGIDPATIAANLEVPPKMVTGRLAQLSNDGMYPAAELLKAVQAVVEDQKRGKAA